MKKRLRKKLGVGEFQELGFEFFADMDNPVNRELFDKFSAVIEALDFYCEGSWDENGVDLYISTGVIFTDNEERKKQFEAKIAEIPEFKNAKFSEMITF